MNPNDQKWPRLTSAARGAVDPRDTAAPYGFATRVAALAFSGQAAPSLLERFSLRALGLAGLAAALFLVSDYSTLVNAFDSDTAGVDDPVAEVIDLAS